MTIRSNPHIWFAIALGFVSTLVSWRFLNVYSPIPALTVGVGVMALILFFYPQGRTSIDLDHEVIRLSQGKRHISIQISEIQGYWIDRVSSLRLVLLLKDGSKVTHSLEFVTSLRDVESGLRELGVVELDVPPRTEAKTAEQAGTSNGG